MDCFNFYILFLFTIALILTLLLIIYSFKTKTIYEDLNLRDNIIEENKGLKI